MIKTKNYFITEEENGIGNCIVLTSNWHNDLVSIIEKEQIAVLRLSRSAGWKDHDVSFLKSLPNLRGIEIYNWDVKDLSPLQFLSKVELIGLECGFTKIPDLSNFMNLKICELTWRPNAKSIFKCKNIKLLNIVNYPYESLANLEKMSQLERLLLTSRKLKSLDGISSLRSLRILDLFACPMLESIEDIKSCNNLNSIELESCRKFHDIPNLKNLTNLEILRLADCKNIQSLDPVSNTKNLREILLTGDTFIEDGEFGKILNLPKLQTLVFSDRSHYSHKYDDIQLFLKNKS